MLYFYNHYVGENDEATAESPLLAPLLTEDLRGLPPALVITAEFDPLRDEGKAYAERLKEAGVAVTYLNYEGMIHAFYQMPGILSQARQAIDESATALRQAFGTA